MIKTDDLKKEALALYEYNKRDWDKNYEERMRKCWKALNRVMDDNYPLQSKLYIPKIFANIVVAASQITDAVFSNRDMVSFVPTISAPEQESKNIEYLINEQYQKMNIFWSLYKRILNAASYGYGIGKIYWNVLLNLPEIQPVSCFEIFWDRSCEWNLQKAGYIQQVQLMSLHDIKKRCKNPNSKWNADEKVLDKLPSIIQKRIDEITGKDSGESEGGSGYSSDRLKFVRIIETWVEGEFIDMVDDGSQGLSLNHSENEFDFFPYSCLRFLPMPDETIGEGYINPALPLQQELNNQRNIALGIGLNNASPGLLISGPGANEVLDEDLVWDPEGRIIRITTGNTSIQPFGVPPPSQMGFMMDRQTNEDIDRMQGISGLLRGEIEAKNESAMSVGIRSRTGAKRSGLDIFSVGQVVKEDTSMMIEFNRRYMADRSWISRETGEEVTMSRVDMHGSDEYDFTPICNTAPIKEINREQSLMMYQLLLNNPLVNQQENTSMLLESFDVREREKLLMPANVSLGLPGEGLITGQRNMPPTGQGMPQGAGAGAEEDIIRQLMMESGVR